MTVAPDIKLGLTRPGDPSGLGVSLAVRDEDARLSSVERGRVRSITDAVGIFTGAAVGASNNAAVIQAHLDAIETAGGGALTAPEGDFHLEAEINPPLGVPFEFRGAGKGATTLRFPTDLGSGAYAIRGTGTWANNLYPLIRDMSIIGPQAAGGVGTQPASMNGVQLERKWRMHNVHVEGFYANIVIYGNSQRVTECRSRDGYYNVYFITIPSGDPMNGSQFGDQKFTNCDLYGARFANIAVGNNTGMVRVKLDNVNLGFAPYNIYREAGTTSGTFIGSCVFICADWEEAGNGHIVAEDMDINLDVIADTLFLGVENTANLGQTAPSVGFNDTYKIAARANDYAIQVGEMRNCVVLPNAHLFANPGAVAVVHAKQMRRNKFFGMDAAIDALATYGKHWLVPFNSSSVIETLTNQLFAYGHTYRIGTPFAAVAAGDLLHQVSGQPNQINKASGQPEIGVAAEAGTGTSDRILFATSGDVTVNTAAADGTITAGNRLKRDGTNAGKVVIGVATDGDAIVGYALAANAGGTIRARLRGLE